jgi:2-dehydropantoate 2-reductase
MKSTPDSTSTASTPLRIAVIGPGGIGSTFAFQLSRVGRHDVTVIARPGSPRLTQLRAQQAIVDVRGQRAEVRVADALDETIPYDLVIVTLLAHQVDAVLPALSRSAAHSIQFMFNNFEPERLRDAVGSERACFGMPFVQATIDGQGRLRATIGAAGQRSLMDQKRWVDLFNASGLPAALEPEMVRWLRCHVPLCVAFEAVAVAGTRRGGGASWSESMTFARGAHEGFRLVQALGFSLYPSAKRWMYRLPVWTLAVTLWTLSRVRSFRELLATGAGECRALVDAMLAAADRAKAPVRAARLESMRPALVGEPHQARRGIESSTT